MVNLNPKHRDLACRLVLFTLGALCFANSYDGNFVFDDTEAITNNKDLNLDRPLTDLFGHDFWGNKLNNESHKSYRPVTVLTFRLSVWLFSGHNQVSYHTANIFIHGLVCVLLFSVFKLLLQTKTSSEQSASPFVCGVLFAVHPIHSESVAAIVGRADLLCALFFIISFLCYAQGAQNGFQLTWFVPSQVACCLATFSKEQGITAIGLCSAYDLIYLYGVDFGRILGKVKQKENAFQNGKDCEKSTRVASLVKRQILLLVSACLQLGVRLMVMGLQPPTFTDSDNPHTFVNNSIHRFLNYNYLYSINAWLLLSPHWLCFDWSMGCVPTITSFNDPRILAVVIFWTVLVLIAVTCLRNSSLLHRKRVTIAISITVVTFLPASNLLFRVGFVIAERQLYLPSMGFCLLVGLGYSRICRSRLRLLSNVCMLLLICVFVTKSIKRSNDWRNEWTLYKSGQLVCPNNAKVHYNIGKNCADAGLTDEAVERYRHALSLNPKYAQVMNNLANILKDRGEVLEAESLLDKAVEIVPKFDSAWMNRGIVKAALDKMMEAKESYMKAISLRANYPDCYFNLGNLYTDMNEHQLAMLAYQNATKLKPSHWGAWNNAIILLERLERYDQAEKLAMMALQYIPNNAKILYSLANIYGKQEKYEDAETFFLQALQQKSDMAQIYANLGVLYHRWGRLHEAETQYLQALKLDPSSEAKKNLVMLRNKLAKI